MSGSLFGTHQKQVDAKGRLSIPKSFRDALETNKQPFAFLVMLDGILSIFTESAFNFIDQQIQNQSPLNRKARELQRLWGSMVTPISWDSTGRITLTELQKYYAGIDREVVLIGARNRLEIWSRKKHEHDFRQNDQRFSEIADELISLS